MNGIEVNIPSPSQRTGSELSHKCKIFTVERIPTILNAKEDIVNAM